MRPKIDDKRLTALNARAHKVGVVLALPRWINNLTARSQIHTLNAAEAVIQDMEYELSRIEKEQMGKVI